jgi:hypothetical protein
MTVKNLEQSVSSEGYLTLTWEGTEEFSFVYEDAKVVGVVTTSGRSWWGPYKRNAVYQVVDSATQSPTPAATDPQPPRYMTITWNAVPTAARYAILLDGQSVGLYEHPSDTYTYTTPRLSSGAYTIKVLAYDSAGNVDNVVTSWPFKIDSPPNPIRGITLTNGTTPGDVSLEIIPPIGV